MDQLEESYKNTDSKIAEDVDFEIENYLLLKEESLQNLLMLIHIFFNKSYDKFDIAHGYDDSLESALKTLLPKFWAAFTSDWMFSTSNGKEICLASIKANKNVQILN